MKKEKLNITKEELLVLINMKLSIKQIATHLGVCDKTIKTRLKEFELSTLNKRGFPTKPFYCAVCGEIDSSKFHLNNKSLCKQCMSNSIIDYGKTKKSILVETKGGKCQVCGYNKCIAALDFHHLDPKIKDKKPIGIMYLEEALEEIKKCILVCSNCHREIHAGLHLEYLIKET